MLSGEKILVTGPAGQIAFPMSRELAKNNEVWGMARFRKPEERTRVEEVGIKAVKGDLASGDFSELPSDFTYVLHLAAYIEGGEDYEAAIRGSAESTGLLMAHTRKAKAFLCMSTNSTYRSNPDPRHLYKETDPPGDPVLGQRTYAMSKNMEEAVARTCARIFNLPTIIARMNVAYGAYGNGGLPGIHLDMIKAGQTVKLRSDPSPYSPIHEDDIFDHVEPLLKAATVPATIVNWCGDEVITAQEWCGMFGEALGVKPNIVVEPMPGCQPGSAGDPTKRKSITGPCKVKVRDGLARQVAQRGGK
jgi:nucleoside-diphosphate-sugar epimerase